jgi:hypothetical protein
LGHRSGFPIIAGALLLFALVGCRPSRVLLSPAPSEIESIEGHARVWLSQPEGTRTKFAFALSLPDQGSIEVSDFLGRSLYRILVTPDAAFLVIPAKRVFWKGDEVEIFERFLGFPLDLNEMISLISGEWSEGPGARHLSDWQLERDERGRITAGQRGALSFVVGEFVSDTPFPRSLQFVHPGNTGRLKILKMEFNRPLEQKTFALDFLREYAAKTWEEIQDILNDAG